MEREKKMIDRLICVLGVKEHLQSQGWNKPRACARLWLLQCSSGTDSTVVHDIPVMNKGITAFTYVVWMHLAPWHNCKVFALGKFLSERKELIRRANWLISEE